MIKIWNREEIYDLARRGYSASQIIDALDLDVTPRTVQKIVSAAGITKPYRKSGRQQVDDDARSGSLGDIIVKLMVELCGLDPFKCGLCGRATKKRCDIHHTKYEGATLYDLVFVCRRCNTAPSQVGLS